MSVAEEIAVRVRRPLLEQLESAARQLDVPIEWLLADQIAARIVERTEQPARTSRGTRRRRPRTASHVPVSMTRSGVHAQVF